MENERKYLYRAIEKTGVAVIVMRLLKMYNGKARIDYISGNAEFFGMNIRSLREGFRLPMDYIHPEDRDNLAREVRQARLEGREYSCEVRFVDDGGYMRVLRLDVISEEETGGDIVMEFLIREPVIQKPHFEYDYGAAGGEPVKPFGELFEEYRAGELIREFANSFDLYSAVVDMRGVMIGEAVGPSSYYGEFYEMLRNPDNLEYFENLKAGIRSENGPVYSEIPDGNPDNRFSAAPICVNGIYTATWLLYAHTRQQNQKLFYIHEKQGAIADILSDYLTILSKESGRSDEMSEVQKELDFIRRERSVLSELRNIGDKKELFRNMGGAGNLLDIDYIIFYSQDKKLPEKMTLDDYWCRMGKSPEAEAVFAWDNDRYSPDIQRMIREDGLVIDQTNMTNQMRVEVFNGNVRAIMVFPVIQKGQYVGRMIFLENAKERIWTEEEITFARMLTQLFATKQKASKAPKKSADITAFEVFDLVEYPIFARDNSTGEVLFSNRAMNLAIGGDFTKKNSFDIIPPAVNAYEGYNDAESASDREDGKQVTSRFRRYVSRLSGIYNVTEHRMKWRDKKPASLFILQEVKEETFGGY